MATCTITIAATSSAVTDAVFNDPSLVSLIADNVANYINESGVPVGAGTTLTMNINNVSYSVTYTVANT